MTRKRKLKITNDVEVRYANWMAQLIAVMQPWSLYWIAGRASAKTVQVLAERVQEVAHDCPGAPFAWVADTYSDLHKNVIPSLIDGLSLLGWIPDVHFVINREPPREWKQRMYNVCTDWRNTMVFYTGFNFTFISLDRAAIGAGRSYVGVFGDEVKYFPEEKFTNLLKAVRGFRVKYGDSVWYRSRTLTTDMPNPNHLGEYDWILKLARQNDKQRILLALRAGFVYNDTKREYLSRLQEYNSLKADARTDPAVRPALADAERQMMLARRTMERWERRWVKTRRGVSFFFISSSYVNVDILGEDWFNDEFAEGLEGAACNILSVIPKLEASQMFYCNLSMKNFYADGFLNEVIEQHPFGWEQDCTVLRYLDPGRPLEAGMDAGNMLSMVFGQQTGRVMRILKELYTLPPQNVRDLADKFLAYFKPHRRKLLKLYYDRSMNNYKRVSTDMASQIKKAIETDAEGRRTGWTVQLMSLGQGNISSNLEYRFFMDLLPGNLARQLYTLLIDQHNCPNLKSEMEVTRTKAKVNERDNTTQIVKEKTGDKLPVHRLPRESTNLTDALKYFVLRPEVVRMWQSRSKVSGAAYL
ncbi:hypothetical protein H6B32_05855 [Bacteroides gallinaceum]|uniref:hypothetical protein n=1 Tax=Bacteroides gallinaceum TaxID=1462571 RepID=UPI0019592526|nr:hypothetical protein [Bacteroides gallinaceum]MBM6944710.1 hypothetical protein [Bacteroides gallinaceum]